MKKLECDVIRDLLPSYVDEICCETSRRYVDEHLQDCPACERLMRQLRSTDFSANKLEQREIDGYKKVTRQINRQGISSALLAAALGFSAIAGSWLLVHGGGGRCIPTFYVLLGICIACTVYFTYVRKPVVPVQKSDCAMGILSILGTTYLIFLLLYCLAEFKQGRMPFGGTLPASQIGARVRCQLDAAAILQMFLYGVLLWRLIKKKINNGWILCLCVSGACVSHLYKNYFGAIDLSNGFVDETVYVMFMTAIALGIGLAGIAVSFILSKVRTKMRD